ncbi:MAG: sterol desaturase family protein [Gammaproteobacteria bacterium]|nr:sterol desaturase family protein [Gammaproteobacteria bacterium]
MLSIILDAQTAVRLSALLAIVLVVASWEILWPRRPLSISKVLRWSNNWAISLLNSLLLYLVFPVLGVGFALLLEDKNWGLFNVLAVPVWLSIPLFVLIFDCAIYWQHRLYHWVPLLWRLHRMHHADPDFDVSTGIRFHPVSIVLSMLIKLLVIGLFGPAAIAVLLSEVLLNVTSMFNHGNIAIPTQVDKWLRLLVVTPDMHRLHHSVSVAETNSNFGFNFPWWDRLFGSYRDQPDGGHLGMEIGVRGFQRPEDQMLHRLIAHPWYQESHAQAD